MAIDFNDQLQKKAADFGTDIKIHRTTSTRGGEPGGGVSPGDTVPGGGVVTEVTDSTVAVEFPDGAVPEHVDMPGSETTVVAEFGSASSTDPGSGVYVNGQGPTVGQHLPDGGVVTDVGTDTVTITYPDGAPQGPIEVPWVNTTVIEESAPTEDIHVGSTVSLDGGLSLGDLSVPTQGTPTPGTPTPNMITAQLPNPGGLKRSLRLAPQKLINFTNSSTSSCAVIVLFIDGGRKVLRGGELVQPGQLAIPKIVPPNNAAIIAIFTDPGCTAVGDVTISWQNP